jgi:hypothetical protein
MRVMNWFQPDLPPGWNHSFAANRPLRDAARHFFGQIIF